MSISYIENALALEDYLTQKNLTWEQCMLPTRMFFKETFPVRIPIKYADLIDWENPNDPLRMMVIPDPREHEVKDYELIDPIGDTTHEPVPGLVHRYPDRALLILTTYCGVHCRFCFRREYIGKPRHVDITACFEYLSKHPEIREVIFTGGDPATFPEGFLFSVLEKLSHIDHIKFVRFHTRALVMDPRMNPDSWLNVLKVLKGKQVLFALHINHPKEISKDLKKLVGKLRQRGVALLSQTVLLKGVNDTTETLKELFVSLVGIGIQPYYLHHLDYARGTHHFRISVENGQKLFSSLRGQIPGHCIPEYVVDLPGGDGKYPVMWLKDLGNGMYEAKNYRGERVEYKDPSFVIPANAGIQTISISI